MKSQSLIVIAGLALLAGCGKQDAEMAQQEKTPAQEPAKPAESTPPAASEIPKLAGDTITTPSGLRYIEMTAGTGASPTNGQMVETHYTGWLANGTEFDSSRRRGQTLSFPLGAGRVIRGWDEGILSMKVGGRRLLLIPTELAWGVNGRAPQIPPNADVVFDVELVGIQ